jgi:hypothetical protein
MKCQKIINLMNFSPLGEWYRDEETDCFSHGERHEYLAEGTSYPSFVAEWSRFCSTETP